MLAKKAITNYFMQQLSLFDLEQIEVSSPNNESFDEEYQSIVLKSEVKKDRYTDYIQETYDLQVGDVSKVCIPNKIHLDAIKDWNIGVICGASGSGKTTILKNLAKEYGCGISDPQFDSDICLISNFSDITPQEATMLLSQMGLASVPTWIRPFNVLSNGEKYRASLAKAVNDAKEDGQIIFIDEYTSVVDRNVAISMSNALQKYIRNHHKKIVLATCHYDIFDWLKPDWIYDLNKGGTLERGDYLRQQRPKIELQVYRTTCDTWERFKKYHYMTSDLNEAATCFCFTWNETLVAFVAVLPFPNGLFRNAFREHRLVVLPDFQGFGFGVAISEFVGGILKNDDKIYFTKTVNPALGEYREKSPNWKPTSGNRKGQSEKEVSKEHNMMGGQTRVSYCHSYIGQPVYGYEELLLPIESIRYNKSMENQLLLNFE